MELIEREAVLGYMKGWKGETVEYVRKLPAIDAVPVTLCRDCTRHRVEQIKGHEVWRCPLRELDVGPDYYCADGVRE